jgi:hypothetical protein
MTTGVTKKKMERSNERRKSGERENRHKKHNVEKNGGDIDIGWPTLLKTQMKYRCVNLV